MKELVSLHCVPCEGGTPPLPNGEENKLLEQIPEWNLIREKIHKVLRKFEFDDFKEAIQFVNKVAKLAEKEGHHPNIKILYNIVELELYTHAIEGLSDNDFILAAKINKIADQYNKS